MKGWRTFSLPPSFSLLNPPLSDEGGYERLYFDLGGDEMGADYQRKKNNPYYLPRTLYRRALAIIRDYERQKEEINNILFGTSDKDGIAVSGGFAGKPTEEMAVRLDKYHRDVDAVEKALSKIPPEYQKGVFRNIVYRENFSDTACYNTWTKWKQRFVWNVAKNKDLV